MSIAAWNRLVETWFTQEDRAKVEWSIGAVLEGNTKKILLISGDPATGKSSVLALAKNIFIENWNDDVAALGVSIQHDGLTKIAHNAFTFAASLVPASSLDFSITKSLIEAHTTGKRIPQNEYWMLVERIDSDNKKIALHCIERYRALGRHYYG